MIVLGIETSCDESAAAVVALTASGRRIRSSLVHSQIDEHAVYGGVVPEIAARAHLSRLGALVSAAVREAGIAIAEIDGVAAAAGPGLIGGLIVGTMMAKGVAWAIGKPFVAVNHLEAHALTVRLTDGLDFPFLLLLVSGGHCQLLACAGVGRYERLGTTLDDAAGEAFDKAAKLIGLPYPGGPAIERAAIDGDPRRFPLPRPLVGRPGCDFSFSGLKTSVRRIVADRDPLSRREQADLAASVEAAICEALCDRTANAIGWFRTSSSRRKEPRRRRRCCGQSAVAGTPGGARRCGRAQISGATAGALHRQCRDDRSGRASSGFGWGWSMVLMPRRDRGGRSTPQRRHGRRRGSRG